MATHTHSTQLPQQQQSQLQPHAPAFRPGVHDVEASKESQEEYETEPTEDYKSKDSEASLEEEKDRTASGGNDGGNVEKVVSKASVNNVSSIPNGGWVAWSQVAGAFLILFNTWGVVNTFGVYQTYYESGELFEASSSNLSWVGALQACLLLLVGSLTGPIYDAGYFRYLLVIGSFLLVFGQMMLSLCTEYWQVLLAQAVCIGLGTGCLFIPGVAIISTYFTTKVALALGVAASGSSFGGVIYPIVFHKLQPQIGFAWATRVIGFIELGTLLIPNVVMKVRVLPAQKRKLIDWSAWTEPQYVFYVLGSFVGFMGLYVPFFYIQFYAITTGITNQNVGFYLIAILNAASIFGRIVPNFISDKVGPLNIMVPCTFITSILVFAAIGVHSLGAIIVFCLLYGFFSGTFVSLPPAIFVSLSPNRGMIGTRMGMGFSVVSIGVLIGTPIAGAILGKGTDPTDLNFVGIWAYGGALTAAGAFFMLTSRMFKAGWKMKAKV